MTAKVLQMPPPKQINLEAELPGYLHCDCNEILADHCIYTRRCPIVVDGIIVGYYAARLFRTSEFQELPHV